MEWKKEVIMTRPVTTRPEDRQGLGGLGFTSQKENMYGVHTRDLTGDAGLVSALSDIKGLRISL